jgi:hypothetical protein
VVPLKSWARTRWYPTGAFGMAFPEGLAAASAGEPTIRVEATRTNADAATGQNTTRRKGFIVVMAAIVTCPTAKRSAAGSALTTCVNMNGPTWRLQ